MTSEVLGSQPQKEVNHHFHTDKLQSSQPNNSLYLLQNPSYQNNNKIKENTEHQPK